MRTREEKKIGARYRRNAARVTNGRKTLSPFAVKTTRNILVVSSSSRDGRITFNCSLPTYPYSQPWICGSRREKSLFHHESDLSFTTSSGKLPFRPKMNGRFRLTPILVVQIGENANEASLIKLEIEQQKRSILDEQIRRLSYCRARCARIICERMKRTSCSRLFSFDPFFSVFWN